MFLPLSAVVFLCCLVLQCGSRLHDVVCMIRVSRVNGEGVFLTKERRFRVSPARMGLERTRAPGRDTMVPYDELAPATSQELLLRFILRSEATSLPIIFSVPQRHKPRHKCVL